MPVLAAGSNGAPVQLARKFDGTMGAIPVTRALLADWAVAYSAHFTRYGSLPATLVPCPGAQVWLFVNWLSEAQLQRMHETEALGRNYGYVELEGQDITVEGRRIDRKIGAYRSLRGPLRHAGRPIRMAEVPTACCMWPALLQRAALRLAHRRLAPELDYGAFVTTLARDEVFRERMTDRLNATRLELVPAAC